MYKKAALLKNDWAMDNLGDMYRLGNGVEQNYTEAMKWYKEAANLGNGDAMGHIGNLYYSGLGVGQDYNLAV